MGLGAECWRPILVRSFADDSTRDIFDGFKSKKARKSLDPKLFPIAFRKLDMINAATNLTDLRIPPSNHLEALKGNLRGWHSIRINDQYRIIFRWTDQGAEQVKITDYH